MSQELEYMWDAMKSVHYQRTIDQLEQSIQNVKRLEDALTVSLDMVVNAVHAQAGTFWYYDQFGDGRIHPKAVYGGGDILNIALLPGEGIAGQVVESGKSVIIANCQKDPRWAGKVDAKTGFKTESMICVPLALGTIVFGSIQIINKTDGVAFDNKDLAFAEQLASASAELFRRQGLLDDYLEAAGGLKAPPVNAVTFMQVFGAVDDRELERQLRKVDEFSALRVSEQEAVLKIARELRGYFSSKKKGGRFFWQ